MIGLGIPLCLLGRKLFSFTLFCVGTLVTMTLILLIFYSTFLKDSTEAWVGWTVLVCSILIDSLEDSYSTNARDLEPLLSLDGVVSCVES